LNTANHYHVDARQSGAPGGGENDHPRKRDTLQSRRMAASYIMLPAVTQKLFSEIAPKFADRAGGYTRIIHAGNRVGDNAKVAILELIGYEFKLKEKKEKPKKEETAEVRANLVFKSRNSCARSGFPGRAFVCQSC